MNVDAAEKADQAMATLEDDKYARTMGKLDAELTAAQKMYGEKRKAAEGNAVAILEIDQWLANEQARIGFLAAAAGEDYSKTALKDYQEFASAKNKIDQQAHINRLTLDGEYTEAARQMVMDDEANQAAAIELQKQKWIDNGLSKVAADARALELIEHNHALSATKLEAITKASSQAETQMRLQAYGSMIAAGEGFVNAIGTQNKALFLISKAAAAAGVIVHGMEAIGQIHGSTVPYAWPELDLLANISTGLQLATIAATTIKGFQGGGYTGDGPENEVAGQVHRKEVVWSAGDVSRAGGRDAVESMRRGGAGQSGGDSYHFGGHTIAIQGNVSPEQAYQIGSNIGQGEYDRLSAMVQDAKRAKYLNVPEWDSVFN